MGEQRGQGNEMKASFAGMDIGYQADFDVPLFDVIPQAPELQARIYAGVRKLYPYALNMDDIHVATNGMQSDTGLRIKMFGGQRIYQSDPDAVSYRLFQLERERRRGLQELHRPDHSSSEPNMRQCGYSR